MVKSNDNPINQAFLQRLRETVFENLEDEQFGVEDLSKKVGISRSQLHRKLKKLQSKSISQFIREVRLQEAMKLIQQDVATASEIAYRVGFSSPSYFFKCFQKFYGYSPGEVAKLHASEQTSHENFNTIRIGTTNNNHNPKNVSKPLVLTAISLMILILAIFSYFYFSNNLKNSSIEKSIAVLPFKSLSNDEENQHFVDGLVDDLLGRLSLIEEFKVTSRTSSETFGGQEQKKITEIAKELEVSYIVEGSVQKQNAQVRIIVQLIDAKNDDHVWVKTFDRDLLDIYEVQSEIAMLIASGLKLALSEQQIKYLQKNQTENIKAMELYQLGRYHWSRRTEDWQTKALSYFQQAIKEDSEYALAYAGIAEIYHIGNFLSDSTDVDIRKTAIEYANRALEINPEQVEAYTILASIHSFNDCDWILAEKEFKYGMSLSSNHSTLYHRYSEHLMNTGRFEESRAAIDKAVALDPLSFIVRTVSAENYYDNGFFDEALEEIKICQDLISGQFHWRINDLLFATYYHLGKYDLLLEEYKNLKKNGLDEKLDDIEIDSLFQANAAEGLIRRYAEITCDPFHKSVLHGLIGDKENCIQWLMKSQKVNPTCAFHSWYEFKIIHDDPRYIALLSKVGLPWQPEGTP